MHIEADLSFIIFQEIQFSPMHPSAPVIAEASRDTVPLLRPRALPGEAVLLTGLPLRACAPSSSLGPLSAFLAKQVVLAPSMQCFASFLLPVPFLRTTPAGTSLIKSQHFSPCFSVCPGESSQTDSLRGNLQKQ